MLQFFIKSGKFQETKPKNPFSGSFLEVFQLHRLLRSVFWQLAGLIKIHNRVEFYEYSSDNLNTCAINKCTNTLSDNNQTVTIW